MGAAADRFLRSTPTIDLDHPRLAEFTEAHAGKSGDSRQQAVDLYYAVRDRIRYDPYRIEMSVDGLRASETLAEGHGWCVSKAILLAACCRSLGVPARLGYADVRNHLSTPRMLELMQTDVFFWHGYTELRIDGRWVKATPAFNRELCDKFHLRPLEFDGTADSIYHPFDLAGNRHMEYLNDRGWFDDVPVDAMLATWLREYPGVYDQLAGESFEADVADARG